MEPTRTEICRDIKLDIEATERQLHHLKIQIARAAVRHASITGELIEQRCQLEERLVELTEEAEDWLRWSYGGTD